MTREQQLGENHVLELAQVGHLVGGRQLVLVGPALGLVEVAETNLEPGGDGVQRSHVR